MGRIRRASFEITEERMFWETGSDGPASALSAVVTAAAGRAEREHRAAEAADRSTPAQVVNGPVPAEMERLTDGPAANDASPETDAAPAGSPHSTIDRVGTALPVWALEPEWTTAPQGAPPRRRKPLIVAAGASLAAAALAVGALGVAGHSSSRPTRTSEATTTHLAHRSRAPMVLAAFQAAPGKSQETSVGNGDRGRSGEPRPSLRRKASQRPDRNRRQAEHPSARRYIDGRVGSLARPASAPASQTTSVVSRTASTAQSARGAAPAVSSPSPASRATASGGHSSGSSEFNFEQ